MQRVHKMPFGAELTETGSTCFRLWAPTAADVKLLLHHGPEPEIVEMEKGEQGWCQLLSTQAPAGTRYQYLIDGKLVVPDPASRFQPADVDGPSQVVAPMQFNWQDGNWAGRPWSEAVIYELNVGAFCPQGNYKGVQEKLDYLVDLGITAVELMPLADFPGRWGWGYDGVLPFAPDHTYGTPADLKELIQAAHNKGLMVFLDVVYNHFGPCGNYLHAYAEPFFSKRHTTPWGAALNFDADGSQIVRRFVVENALFWLSEYHFDGLRLDAVNAIEDHSAKHILEELAETVYRTVADKRHVHLVLENGKNEPSLLTRDSSDKPCWYVAQWNDDFHHAIHVLTTKENSGYYADYTQSASSRSPIEHLGRTLAYGFDYQGEPSSYRGGVFRGAPSGHLPPTAFVTFTQNHDQVGNRAFGERLIKLTCPEAARAAAAILLLAPQPPLLFMGQEWETETPFYFFSDPGSDLAPLVAKGRQDEFAKFPDFVDSFKRQAIPDPCIETTFRNSLLDWSELEKSKHQIWWQLYRKLLTLRRQIIIPLLPFLRGGSTTFQFADPGLLSVHWKVKDAPVLALLANLSAAGSSASLLPPVFSEVLTDPGSGKLLFQTQADGLSALQGGFVLPWSVFWFLDK